MLSIQISGVADVITTFERSHHVSEGGWRVLKIIVHDCDKLTANVIEPCHYCIVLPGVFSQVDAAYKIMCRSKGLNDRPAIIGSGIIYEDQFERA
ncbi:hypothetical protein D3C72_1889420 [compost metagenome]